MWISLHNVSSVLTQTTDRERVWLSQYLSFRDGSYQARRDKNARVNLFNTLNSTFPSGFIPLVKHGAEQEGFKVELLDRRVKPCERDPNADLEWLRSHPASRLEITHQIVAVEECVKRGRGILQVPTGGGKTEIAVGLATALPCRWLFLVHRASLLDQAAERYEKRTGKHAGRVGDGGWDWQPATDTFVVATFQTLHAALARNEQRALALLDMSQGLIVDECHVLPADSFWKVAMSAKNAYFRIGMSGTPLDRTDNRSILAIAATGPRMFTVTVQELEEKGILAKASIRFVPVDQETEAPTYQGVYGEGVVRSAKRNRALVSIAHRARKPCLLFVKEVSHGKKLAEAIHKSGIPCEFTWGTHSTEQRKRAIHRLVHGDIEVLVCSVIFQEGIDIRELRSVVNGSGGKSIIAALQRIGRGMRADVAKDEFEVWDIYDKGHEWLENHSRARLKAYTGQGHHTVIEQDGVQLDLPKIR